MRKFVIQVRCGSGSGGLEGQYAATFENGPQYTRDIKRAFTFDTEEEAQADCMRGEQVVRVENPATKKLIEDMKEGANFVKVDEVYPADEILAAADRIRGKV